MNNKIVVAFFLLQISALQAFESMESLLSPPSRPGAHGRATVDEQLLAAAASGDSNELLRALEHPDVSINTRNAQGATPVIIASRKGHLPLVRNLVQFGADLSAEDNNGVNALFAAIAENKTPIVEFLAGQMDVNQQDKHGYTPLMYAVLKKNKPMIQTLVEHNADIHIKDYRGDTAVIIAENNNLHDIAQYLRTVAAGITPKTLAQQLQRMVERGKKERAGHAITQENIRNIWAEIKPNGTPLTAGEIEQLVGFASADWRTSKDRAVSHLGRVSTQLIRSRPHALDHIPSLESNPKEGISDELRAAWHAIAQGK
jgi:hypothetical protein